jgi:hypothetical protein
MKAPAIVEKYKQGPVGMMAVFPSGNFWGCGLSDHRLFRGVPDGTHRRAGSYVSGGLSCSTTASMAYGLGNLSNRHLERAALVDDHKGSHRRACLPLADSRDVRLAVAALNKELRPTRRRHTQSATLAAERSF